MPTVDELKAELDEAGIDYPSKATKAELEALVPSEPVEDEAVEETPEEVSVTANVDGSWTITGPDDLSVATEALRRISISLNGTKSQRIADAALQEIG